MEDLLYYKCTRFGVRLGGEAVAEEFDDLFLQVLAAGAPAARAGELHHAVPQAAEAEHLRRLLEAGAHLVAQAREKREFERFT